MIETPLTFLKPVHNFVSREPLTATGTILFFSTIPLVRSAGASGETPSLDSGYEMSLEPAVPRQLVYPSSALSSVCRKALG